MQGEARVGVPRDRVVAVVATLADGQEQLGSGYLVGGRLVLTAEHCTHDKLGTRAVLGLRVNRASDGKPGEVVATVASPALDVAVLWLADTSPWAPELAPPDYARVDRNQTGMLLDCEAVGYPLMQRDPVKKARDTAELHGTIYQTDLAESGRLLMREPLMGSGHVTDPDADPTNGRKPGRPSPWEGLSGALVFYRGRALGVVIEHHPRQGDSALRAMAFDTIAKKAATDPSAQLIAEALGLPAKLPVVAAQSPRSAEPNAPPTISGLPEDQVAGLLTRYLAGVAKTACQWPIGWAGTYHLPDPGPEYQALEVVDAELVSGPHEQPEEKTKRRSWKDVSADYRLIILFGDAGQGKTWTLQNEARTMADAALSGLNEGTDHTTLELPLYCRAPELAKEAGAPDRLAAFIRHSVTWACEGEPVSLQLQMAVALSYHVSKGGRARPIIDALDEVPAADSTATWSVIRTCMSDRRAILASRRFGFTPGFAEFSRPRDGYFVLQPLSDHLVIRFARHWYGGDRNRQREFLGELDRTGLAPLARVPLFLSMMCILHDSPEGFPQTRVGLLEAMSRRILGVVWKFDQRPAPETIDDIMELASRLAWYFSAAASGWRDQIPVAEVLEAILDISRGNRKFGQPRRKQAPKAWAKDQLSTLRGLLVIDPSTDLTSAGDARFTHRVFHEFLTAMYMARYAEEDGMKLLQRVWWLDPDWIDAIQYSVAISPSPAKWISALAESTPDTFCAGTTLALQCIALAPAGIWSPQIDEVIARALRLLAQFGKNAPGSNTVQRLRDAVESLPREWVNRQMGESTGHLILLPERNPVRGTRFADALDLDDDVDAILDEIDEVLEENAEEFVRSFVFPVPFSRVRLEGEASLNELTARVADEWLRTCPPEEQSSLQGPVSGSSPWSIPDFIESCRHRDQEYLWSYGWMEAILQAIAHGEVAVTVAVCAGLLLAVRSGVVKLAAHVLSREPIIMSATMLEEFSRTLGSLGNEAAAAVLQVCQHAGQADVYRLVTDRDDNVRDKALSSIRYAEHQSLIDSLEPLIMEGVQGVRSAVAFYLHNSPRHFVPPEALMALINDGDPQVRERALERFIEKCRQEDEELVEQLLENETDVRVRVEAILTLGRLKHPWVASLAIKGYLSNQPGSLTAAWAHIAVAHASAQAPERVLRRIATDQAVGIITRLDAVRSMWHRGMKADVIDIAATAASDTPERKGPPLYWTITRRAAVSRSDVELLCILLERARARDPLRHPLWLAADGLSPNLGITLRNSELRNRFRAALYRFENSAISE